MRNSYRALLAAALLGPALLWGADAGLFKVSVDTSQAPEAASYAVSTKALCEEWYPKINAALFGADYPLPFEEVKVLFEPSIMMGPASGRFEVPAYANGNTIHINTGYVIRTAVEQPKDYPAMFIHELTHVNQHYSYQPKMSWLVEGIADYVRHKYFEKDIEPKLHLDANGHLRGFELDRNKGTFEREGYLGGYTVAGAFLYWLEVSKDQKIVPELNLALREERYSDELFKQYCGSPLPALWHEFIVQSMQ